ncbi:SOS response-associated peptidase [Halomonas caseinilytica]|uniref:Abasic site processing protein n=1 Tax=Halomonas caseinilytica TaxID=438744 RepID=A0A1M7BB34_9GAMM|nr:SOS response-associated peptidase [Halomonas caseinilytica]SHL51849.1 Putative SOS response-associated peptidase YedK [Halomonas caseinilytica]
MCGRFAIYSQPPEISRRLGLPEPDAGWAARYNVTPGTWIPGAYRPDSESDLALGQLWWGYRPHWATGNAPEPINAKVEGVATSRYFKGAFARHRCLIPADGWYEWLSGPAGKQPHFICREDREVLWLAGIWSERADGAPGCAILTEPARGLAAEVHDRMPLALDDDSIEPWLDPDLTDREAIRHVVRHIDADSITHWPVSTRVNRPGNDDATLLHPVFP